MNNDIWNRFGDKFNVLLFSCPLCICKLLSLTLWWEYGGHAEKNIENSIAKFSGSGAVDHLKEERREN